MGEWLDFVRTVPNKKTQVWDVYVRNTDTYLGIIKWYAPWRKYCFFPMGEKYKNGFYSVVHETVFEEVCLRDIAKFIETETFRQRRGWK